MRAIDEKIKLTEQLASLIPDYRDPTKIEHSLVALLRQRIYGIALGWEDLNDHSNLRHDPALQTAVNEDKVLASSSTLCRLENSVNRDACVAMHQILVEQFINSYTNPQKELILDFDPTDDEVHGNQTGKHYNGYYGHDCFLPLHVFCGSQLLVSYLRPSNEDGAKHIWAVFSLLSEKLRKAWPNVEIIFRGDAGLCRHPMLRWCERQKGIYYIVGLPGNPRLKVLSQDFDQKTNETFERTKEPQKCYDEFHYAAHSWKTLKRVIVKSEHTESRSQIRYIVTNLSGTPQSLYEEVYCQRGNMENRIKEVKNDLFSDRTSCHEWWANQFRLLLSSMAYVLMDTTRRLALQNTELAQAQCSTIRLKLYKIGAIIVRNTRRIRFLLSKNFPAKDLFMNVAKKLCPS